MLSKDVLLALREGWSLCPQCLGQKVLVVRSMADFIGDREVEWAETCPHCKGKGIE